MIQLSSFLTQEIMSKKIINPGAATAGCLLLVIVAFVSGRPRVFEPPALNQFETRCGWLDNPTPANVWLNDRDGEWTIGLQGGYQVEGEWEWPKFAPRQWVVTNAGSYGYGCACLRLRADRETRRVIEIKEARARPLSACRREPALRKWERKLEQGK